jgi:sulfopyruvate decarboxylase TPP-binding subunit
MFTGPEIAETLASVGFTHVVWVPDSAIGPWEQALESSSRLTLVRVCREGEAWAIAAGLLVGGKTPLVVMQTTGLFESGDALRNVLFDMELPLLALIGARSWLVPDSTDSARHFAEPILKAWGIEYRLIARPEDKPLLAEFFVEHLKSGSPGAVLLAEGPP